MIQRLLIANRGEIACRIIAAARDRGITTLAVFSDADAQARHVGLADEAVRIGSAAPAASYLNVAAILAAARETQADAVHPGYGFLSENAEFAAACTQAGLVFVGPPASAIAAMGNKAAAKRMMAEAGVPCIPGYQGLAQDDATLIAEAHRIGVPLMVKAAAGGGGRGMRLVRDLHDLPAQLDAARSEARGAFGSDELILERAIEGGRHVEVQVIADAFGATLHLGERDCSLQRRHQKIVEEAPGPTVSPDLRAAMGEAAVRAARAVDYVGAGTVEFLLGNDHHFYFLEMNTRIQVEHPVTEMVTGLDLVGLQLDIAAGAPLPFGQEQVTLAGHAIEARLYAEDPAAGFLPQSGPILRWQPPAGPGIRVDHGLVEGGQIGTDYDPMLAKIIAHGPDRASARCRLIAALRALRLLGVATNQAFLIDCLEHPAFVAGDITTDFLGRSPVSPPDAHDFLLCAAGAILLADGGQQGELAGWASTGPQTTPLKLAIGGQTHRISVRRNGAQRMVMWGEDSLEARWIDREERRLVLEVAGVRRSFDWARTGDQLWLTSGCQTVLIEDLTYHPAERGGGDGGGSARAPMNGKVVAVHVAVGDQVAKGSPLVVVEAMKMEQTVPALTAGMVSAVMVKPGDQVAARQVMVEVTPDSGGEAGGAAR